MLEMFGWNPRPVGYAAELFMLSPYLEFIIYRLFVCFVWLFKKLNGY